jgi:nicotinate-nucleotide pyrophosphorylase (carboxylating)
MPETIATALPDILVEPHVRAALLEDLGRAGDITSQATLDPALSGEAAFVARDNGILCGIGLARIACQLMGSIQFRPDLSDGAVLRPGQRIAIASGSAQSLLSAERVALNYLMHLSGIASLTRRYAEAVAHTGAKICCTRKTIPGMRSLQKYAVRCGGGSNHRFGLDDAILIKDNHIALSGGVASAIAAARRQAGHLVAVEVEVDTLAQFEEALAAAPDAILLDNMGPAELRQAVEIKARAGRPVKLEASGNVDLSTVAAIAESGVDFISTSKITMAAPTLDIGLDIEFRADRS